LYFGEFGKLSKDCGNVLQPWEWRLSIEWKKGLEFVLI
jgi:hypothetical protein